MSQNDEAPKHTDIPDRVDLILTEDHKHMLTLLLNRMDLNRMDLLKGSYRAVIQSPKRRGRPVSDVTAILTHLVTVGLMESLKAHGIKHLLSPRSSPELLCDNPLDHDIADIYKAVGELVLLNGQSPTPDDDKQNTTSDDE